MATESVDLETHRKLARSLFNHTWTLLEKPNRSRADDDEMVHAAHASRYHWGAVGDPEHWACGEWQIARVYAVLGRGEQSRHHAQRSLDICQENSIGDFYLASAYEGLAHAAKVMGQSEEMKQYIELAQRACAAIKDSEDRKHIESQINGHLPAKGQ